MDMTTKVIHKYSSEWRKWKSQIRFTCWARGDVSNLHLIGDIQNQAMVLKSAFWGGEVGEAQSLLCLLVFSVQSCEESWLGWFLLYYCCLWHNRYIILESFEKLVYSSIAYFHCARNGIPGSLREAEDSLQQYQRGIAIFRIFREYAKTCPGNIEFPRALELFLWKELTSALEKSAFEIT